MNVNYFIVFKASALLIHKTETSFQFSLDWFEGYIVLRVQEALKGTIEVILDQFFNYELD